MQPTEAGVGQTFAMPKRPLTRPLNAGAAAVLLLLAGCSAGAEPPRARSQDRDVSFSSCAQVECAGEIDGAAFQILMPEQWNGTLLLWSHGIRAPEPIASNL